MGATMSIDMEEGLYFIKTKTTHAASKSSWGLTVALPNKNKFSMLRNSNSAWVYAHESSIYNDTIWKVSKGNGSNRWKISVYRGPTYDSGESENFGVGWTLGFDTNLRNGSSTWLTLNSSSLPTTEWIIEPQETKKSLHQLNFYKIATINKISKHSPPLDMRMAMWHSSDGYRNSKSAKMAVHTGDYWPIDLIFSRYYILGSIHQIPWFVNDNKKMNFKFTFKAAKFDDNRIVQDKNYKFTLRFYLGSTDILNRQYWGDNKGKVLWSWKEQPPDKDNKGKLVVLRPDKDYVDDVKNGRYKSPSWFTINIIDERKTFNGLWSSSRLKKNIKMQVEIEITDSKFTSIASQKRWKTSITKDIILDPDNIVPRLSDMFYFKTYT